ncbi:MAG: hypothetical protein K1X85_08405 [Ignavibacteria bacterium]|nr:hypothetical protein [Ignavibacteria bacterium]
MSQKITTLFILAVLISYQTGCITDSNTDISRVDVYDVDAPDTAGVNTDIPVLIKFYYWNSCGESAWSVEQRNGRNIHVDVYGSYNQGICLGVIVEDSLTYIFRASSAGKYYMTFGDPANEFVSDTIIIR